MDRVRALFNWLVDGAPGATGAPGVIDRIGLELNAAGLPIERISAFVTTLHPTVLGRSFYWTKGKPARVMNLTMELQRSPEFKSGAVAEVLRTRAEYRIRFGAAPSPTDPLLKQLAEAGFTDYVCLPLEFTNGEMHAIAFATKEPRGFVNEDLVDLREIVRPLSLVAEILATRRVASNLLSTYVGRNCGERILSGNVFRGEIETINAIIWFSDLRGFTEMSSRASPREIVDTLNELFECQVSAIEQQQGEVLKFIGDGLLAIFPIQGDEARARGAAALAAAKAAHAMLDVRNASASRPISFGLALHRGEVAYGNIGGAARLDFTAIGTSVNIAARLEGLTGKLGRPLVVSAEFAALVDEPLDDLGSFELKGVPTPERVFAPARASSAGA